MRLRVTGGRWYTPAEAAAGANVAVLGSGLAATTHRPQRIAFISANHLDPDVAAEMFILDAAL